MEESACDAAGKADQVGLSGENLDPARTRHLRQVDGTAVADLGDVFICGRDARNRRQHPPWVDQ